MSALLERGFVDSFRYLHPEERDRLHLVELHDAKPGSGTSGGASTIFWLESAHCGKHRVGGH